jgi:hypothetical protein
MIDVRVEIGCEGESQVETTLRRVFIPVNADNRNSCDMLLKHSWPERNPILRMENCVEISLRQAVPDPPFELTARKLKDHSKINTGSK